MQVRKVKSVRLGEAEQRQIAVIRATLGAKTKTDAIRIALAETARRLQGGEAQKAA